MKAARIKVQRCVRGVPRWGWDVFGRKTVAIGNVIAAALTPVAFAQSPSLKAGPQLDPYKLRLVYTLPGTERVKVQERVKFGDAEGRGLFVDVYQPTDLKKNEKRAAIIYISGGEDVHDWPAYRQWGRLAAAQGFVGLIPDKRFPRSLEAIRNGIHDTGLLLRFLQEQGANYGVDSARLALWIFSGGGQITAVGLPRQKSEGHPKPKCLVLFYAISGLPPGASDDPSIAEDSPTRAVEVAGSAAPPIFIARAGQDAPFINESIASFVSAGLKANAPLTLVNYPEGNHGFDAVNNTNESRAIIKAAFEFIKHHTSTN